MSQNLRRLSFGVLFAPVAILLHECGHYTAAAALGLGPHLHFADTTIGGRATPASLRLVVAAGPSITALMVLAGLFWLWHLRRDRWQAPVRPTDWFATFLVLCAARWLRCSTGALALHQPSDEAMLSASVGFPPWLLPYLLAPVALGLLVAAVRLHPRGNRLVPFGSAVVGICLGAVLWVKVLGPLLLP
jgi:hypothetical protein